MAETLGPLIISSKKIGRWRLTGGPKPRPGVAVVLFGAGSEYVELLPGQQMTPGERFYSGYMAYEVDIAPRSFRLIDELPTKDPAFSFQADAHVRCRVKSPRRIVEQGLDDPETALTPLILRILRRISPEFEANETAAAERAMEKAVREQDYGLGLVVEDMALQLDLDETASAHAKRLDEIRRQQEIEQATSAAQFEKEIADLKRQLELERARKPVRDETDKQERERKAAWLDFYGPLIQKEQWKLLALQLAGNPESLPNVIAELDDRQQKALAAQMAAVDLMFKHDVLDGIELEESAKKVLQDFLDSFRSGALSLPSIAQTVAEKALPPAGDEAQADEAAKEGEAPKAAEEPDAEEEED